MALAALLLCTFSIESSAQSGGRFGFEDSVNAWTGTASSETAAITNLPGTTRTGRFAMKLSSTSTGTGSKQWYSNTPYASSASGTYIHFIYWAKAAQSGTSADGSLRYGSTAPPTGTNSSANAGADIAIPTTTWERVVNTVTTSSTRHYYPAPRKTLSGGAMIWYIDDGIIYTSALSSIDTTAPAAPASLTGNVSGNIVTLGWTSNTDAGTGVQSTIVLRSNITSSPAPTLNHQAEYSTTGGNAGPGTSGNWTIISTTTGATATSYVDGSAAPGTYIYAIVLRDQAFNYSVAATSATVTVGTPVPTLFADTAGFAGSFGTIVRGSSSAPDSFGISGFNLSSGATVTAPAGFEVSLSATGGYNSLITVPASSGTIVPRHIYVRFSPTTATGIVGPLLISIGASGASTRTIAVNGISIDTEPTSGGSLQFGNVGSKSAVIHLPGIGNGNGRLIVLAKGHEVNWLPTDGTVPAGVNADYSLATELGGGERIVYSGTGSGDSVVVVSGLTPSTLYYAAVFEYNAGTGASHNYLPLSDLTAFARTAFEGVRIAPIEGASGVIVYPNPVSRYLFSNAPTPMLFELINGTGQRVLLHTGTQADLSLLPPGLYQLNLYDGQGLRVQSARIQKQ